MKNIVVLISGRGSNMEAIVQACAREGWPARIAAVISNRPQAAGLDYARAQGIAAVALDHKAHADREAFDAALMQAIDAHAPDLVVLAGFMRILTPAFVRHYHGRMFNIHPSLLPKYKGLDTHRRALDAGDAEHGCSVHFVTEELDGGALVVQASTAVLPGDTPESLAQRVHGLEHRIYPLAVRWFAEGRLRLEGDGAMLDGESLLPTGRLIRS